jgi:protein-disulfide isomerase
MLRYFTVALHPEFIKRREVLMKVTRIFAAIAVGLSLSSFAVADDAGVFTPAQKDQLGVIIHDYIVKNPEVLATSLESMQQKQMDQMRAKGQDAAIKQSTQLLKQASDPVGGNAKGKVTLVEFFDYQCPHCVDMEPAIQATLKANPDLRIVYKEFPIRGDASLMAAKAALAAQKQGKYVEMHDDMMKNARTLNAQKIDQLAKARGLDMKKFKADMESPEVAATIKTNYKLAQDLMLFGTPALFISPTDLAANAPATAIVFIPGQTDEKGLQAAIKQVTKK